MSDWTITRRKRRVSLANCPIGMFECAGELCLKTEYGNNEGRINAYIVSSGEFFWGGARTPLDQRKVLVTPCETTRTALQQETEANG